VAHRPGFVLEVDRSTPPTLFHHGESFRLEKLPVGSRVIYPSEALPTLKDPDAAIRHALLHPVDMDPLPSLLTPGMKLTIAFDDVSLPLPKMKRPDVRQRVIEAKRCSTSPPRPGSTTCTSSPPSPCIAA
jgi:lactate racemase